MKNSISTYLVAIGKYRYAGEAAGKNFLILDRPISKERSHKSRLPFIGQEDFFASELIKDLYPAFTSAFQT